MRGEGFSVAVASADFDNDGLPDLFVAGVNRNFLYRNRGDGTFEDVTVKAGVANQGRWAVSAGWFDYDNDGRLDLFVVNYVKWDPLKEPVCGDAAAGHRSYCHPKFYEGLPNILYHNNGDGTFTDVSERAGIASHTGKGMGRGIRGLRRRWLPRCLRRQRYRAEFPLPQRAQRDVPRSRRSRQASR